MLQHARRPFHAKGAVGRALANLAACVCGACAEPAVDRVENQDKVDKHERGQHYGRQALRDIEMFLHD